MMDKKIGIFFVSFVSQMYTVPKVNNRPYASCITEIENSLSEDTKLTISLCKRNKVYYSPLERVLKLSKIDCKCAL